MKILRTLFAIALITALFAVSSQALAAPAGVEFKTTPPGQIKTPPGQEKTPPGQDKTPPGLVKTSGANNSNNAELEADSDRGNPHGKIEHFKGILTAVDANSITLTLDGGNSVTISLDAETSVHVPTLSDGSFESLQPDMKVMVKAQVGKDGALTAKSIQVIPAKPERTHNVGIVSAYVPGVSISILAVDGETYEFLLAETTKILPLERLPLLVVGARVTIIAPRDVSTLEITAGGIVIHTDAALGDFESPESTEPAETEEPVETIEPIDTVEPI